MLPLTLLALAAAAPPPPASPPLPPSAPPQNCEAGTFLAKSEAGLRLALQCGMQSGHANIILPAHTTINLTSALKVGSLSAEANSSLELPVINISGSGGAAIDAQGLSGVLVAIRVSLYVRGLRIANGNRGCVNLHHALARFEDVSVEGCSSPDDGGGFFIQHSDVAFERVHIRHCAAALNGGGVFLSGEDSFDSSLVALHSSIANCSAGYGSYVDEADGGGLAAESSALFMAHTNITECRVYALTDSEGGGVSLTSTYSRLKSVKIARCSAWGRDRYGSRRYGVGAAGGLFVKSAAGDRMNFSRANVSHSYWLEVPPFTELRDELSEIPWGELVSDVGSWRPAEEPWLLDAYDLEVVDCAAEGFYATGGCIGVLV